MPNGLQVPENPWKQRAFGHFCNLEKRRCNIFATRRDKFIKKIVTDETPITTEQTKNNISSFLFAIIVLQIKKEDDIYAGN